MTTCYRGTGELNRGYVGAIPEEDKVSMKKNIPYTEARCLLLTVLQNRWIGTAQLTINLLMTSKFV